MNKYLKNAAALKRGAKKYFDAISLIEAVERSRYGAVKTVLLEPPTIDGLCLYLGLSPARWCALLDGRYGTQLQEAALWAELIISNFLSLELLTKAKGTDGAKLLWQQSLTRLGSIPASEGDKRDITELDLEGKERLLRSLFNEKE